MATKRGKRLTYEDEQRALDEVAEDPRSGDSRARLSAGLHSKRASVVARAAKLIKKHQVEGFDAELAETFDHLLGEPAKSDSGCQAKVALLEALDYGESMDGAPFLRAVRYEQKEPADTAGGVRARGVLALARIGHEDFGLIAAHLLSDPLASVRQAALDALAHREDPAGGGLAQLLLDRGDEDPLVVLAAMTTLLALAPAWASRALEARLAGDREMDRELAALALGQSRGDEALTVLLQALERCVLPREREPILRGIGLHRSERALETMLAVITEHGKADAKVAIESLAPRRFEPGLTERVRAAVARNAQADLGAVVEELFSRP